MFRGADKLGKVISSGHRRHNPHLVVNHYITCIWSGAHHLKSRYRENIYGSVRQSKIEEVVSKCRHNLFKHPHAQWHSHWGVVWVLEYPL